MGLRNNFDICDGKNDITAILYLKVERGLFGQPPRRWYVVYFPLFIKQLHTTIKYSIPKYYFAYYYATYCKQNRTILYCLESFIIYDSEKHKYICV